MTPRARARLRAVTLVVTFVAIAILGAAIGSGRWFVREGKPIAEAVVRDKNAGTLPGLHPGDESSFSFALARVGSDHEADAIRALVPELHPAPDGRDETDLVTVTFEVLDRPDGTAIRNLVYFYERRPGDSDGWHRMDPVVISEPPAWEPRRFDGAAGVVRGDEKAAP